MLKNVVKGLTTDIEGIKLSKEMAGCYLKWLQASPYGRKYDGLPFDHIFKASFNWGLDRYISKDCKPEYKELKQQAKAMKESTIYTDFSNFVNESYNEINEALKSSKLRNLLSMGKSHKEILKAIYGKTKIALDKVEDHQIQDIDPEDGQTVKGIVFYYTTQEKKNPYADPDSYWNQTFPANALLAIGTGKEFYYITNDYRKGKGDRYSLSTNADAGRYSRSMSTSDVGFNKNYRGWNASGLGSVKRVQAVADAAFVINPEGMDTTLDKRELRAKSREGAIAFTDPKDFKRANELRYKEILTKRASKEPIDKMVEKAIDDIADLMKDAIKNQTKNKYGEIIAGTGADGRAYRINDLTNFASRIMDDYERWASYINQATEAEKALKDDEGDHSYSQYSIKRYKIDAAEYAKSIKDRLKKLKKRNLAW